MIGPATEAGLLLEPSLVETVLADLGDEPGSLPLLSHALFATWQRRRGRVLAVAGYQQAGGVRQTIAHSAERVFGALSPTPQGIAKDVFLRLTALGDGTQDTRRRVRRAELVAGRGAQAIQVVLERLAEARLVTLADNSVEVAHEALIGSVLTGGKSRRVGCFGQMSCPGRSVAFWPSKGATVATDSTGVGPPIPSRRVTIAATVNLLAERAA